MKKELQQIADSIEALDKQYVVRFIAQQFPYTFVEIRICAVDGPRFGGIGFAKCNVTDTFDKQRGVVMATGRALKDLAKNLWIMGLHIEGSTLVDGTGHSCPLFAAPMRGSSLSGDNILFMSSL